MTIVVDPDFLDQNREVLIDTAARKFRVIIDTDASPAQSPLSRIDSDGVTGQALYSFFKEEWKNDATLIPHPFPMIAITPEQFEFIEDWEPLNDTTRKRIKTAGWAEIDELSIQKKEFAGIITLGSFVAGSPTDQAYYLQGTDTANVAARVNFDRVGPVNEPILTYEEDVAAGSPGIVFTATTIQRQDGGDFTAGAFPYQIGAQVTVLGSTDISPDNDGTYTITDVTTDTLTISGALEPGTSNTARLAKDFRTALNVVLRGEFDGTNGKTYDSSNLADIGVTTLTNQAYRFPLSNSSDLKITNSDATIAARSPEVTITYYQAPQIFTGFVADAASTQSPNTEAAFGIIIDAQGYTAEEVYEFVQYQLRQAADINDGGSPVTVVAGDSADELLEFVGDSLQTLSATNPLGGGTGVYITNFDSNDTNRLSFADNEFGTTSRRTFPFVAAGTINFNPNLVSDSMGMFWMFYEYTERFTGQINISGAAGASATIVMSGVALDTELTVSDYIALDNLANPENNGVWQVDTTPTTSPQSITATKVNGDTVVNETGDGDETLDKNPINSPDAIIVDSSSAFSPIPITGAISSSSVAFDYDYDGNVQGGRTSGTDANILLRAIGLETAQFVEATGVITRAVGLSFTLTAGLERNYSNP